MYFRAYLGNQTYMCTWHSIPYWIIKHKESLIMLTGARTGIFSIPLQKADYIKDRT